MFIVFIDELICRYFVPLSTKSTGGKWLKSPPRSLMRERSFSWDLYKNRRHLLGRSNPQTIESFQQFNRINYLCRNYSRYQQGQYEVKLAGLLGEAPKLFHAYLRERKAGCPSVGPLKLPSGQVIHDYAEMGNAFSEAFSSVFVRDDPANPEPYQLCDGNMQDVSVSSDLVVEVLRNLDGSGAPGPDGIHPLLLKNCADVISLPLVLLFKKSLQQQQLPSSWKLSRIIPIFKGVESSILCTIDPLA